MRGRKVKSRDCALVSDLVKARKLRAARGSGITATKGSGQQVE